MNQPLMNADERRFYELSFAINGCAMDVLNFKYAKLEWKRVVNTL